MQGRKLFFSIALLLVMCAVVSPAFAQDTAKSQEQSLWQIFLKGIEIPTWFILAGSVAAISLVVEHFLNIRGASISPADQVKRAKELIEARNFRECLESLRKSTTFFARVMTAALLHARHGFDAMHEAAVEKSGELSGRMFRKAEYLNILGNLGPLLGLLGTVLGMIKAFGSLGGQSGSADLAEGISEALVNTFLGLSLAIIGLGFYGVCRNRIDSQTVSATVQALDQLEYFRVSPKAAAAKRAERAAAPAET